MSQSICSLTESNISYFVGIFLIIYSILNVQLSILGITLPKINSPKKCLLLSFVGVIMILVSFANDNGIIEIPRFLSKEHIRIEQPMYGNYRVDSCFNYGVDCGTIAALKYCTDVQHYSTNSVLFDIDVNLGKDGTKTINLGNNQICDKDYCSGFKYIICQK